MDWLVVFRLQGNHLSAKEILRAPSCRQQLAAAVQVDSSRIQLAVGVEGDSLKAIGRAVVIVWDVIDSTGLEVTIESARLGPDIDCTVQVRALERLRASLAQ